MVDKAYTKWLMFRHAVRWRFFYYRWLITRSWRIKTVKSEVEHPNCRCVISWHTDETSSDHNGD